MRKAAKKKEIRKHFNKKRIYKTITWRFVSTVISMSVAYIVTGSIEIGITIGILDSIIKVVVYWYHEKIWSNYTRKHIKLIKNKYKCTDIK